MSSIQPLGTIVGSRELTFARKDGSRQNVQVLIGQPVEDKRGGWLCPYLIKAETFEKSFRSVGEDSAQSLQLAFNMISTDLDYLAQREEGAFLFDGDPDHGFPRFSQKDA